MPKKILIVDDEPHILELVRVSLEEFDYLLIDAADGEEALAKVRQDPPDLVLLDVMLPKKDGFEVLRELKQDPATRSIPVVLLTARGLPDDRQRGLAAGADGYISKPFSPLKLLTEVQQFLDHESGPEPST